MASGGHGVCRDTNGGESLATVRRSTDRSGRAILARTGQNIQTGSEVTGHPVALGIPIRRNHRKCDAIAVQNDACSAYLIPNSRQVSSTSLEIAG